MSHDSLMKIMIQFMLVGTAILTGYFLGLRKAVKIMRIDYYMKKRKITEIYAWIAIVAKDDEGIVSAQMGDTQMPLLGADRYRIESFRPVAVAASEHTDVKLVKFESMVVLETWKKRGKKT